MTSIGISSSTARLLHSGIHHVNLASFVHGPNSAPLPRSAAFSRRWQITPRTNSRPPPFSSPGVAIPWPSNFVQLFPATAANGLGSAIPPSSLTLSNVTLNSLGFISALPSGTVLQFRISDINTFDNGGQFTVSGQIVTADVPEPSAGLLAIAGIGFLFLIRRRCLA